MQVIAATAAAGTDVAAASGTAASAVAAVAAAWVKLWFGWSPNLHLITYNPAPAQSLWLSLLPL